MSVADATRRLISELLLMLDKKVTVVLTNGKKYEGILIGFDHPSINIMLASASDTTGKKYPKILIKGESISEIMITEEPLFDPNEFAEYLVKELHLRQDAVKVVPEAGAVIVYGRIKVTEKGVEGTGAMAQTIYEVYQRYIDMRKSKLQG
ncbi:Lsm family RNA-binding protein [Desulfurococcaceae archaeon MEX13E-LK6-19]|nr:Lsm family RNA-binding protein [Desulfurococcaceae archaeon MEX13E-LK6-19]